MALLCLPAPASASEPERVDVVLEIDIPVVLTAGLLGLVPHMLREELVDFRCAPDCDRSHINALDATALGYRSEAASIASDSIVAMTLATPAVLGLIDVLVSEGGEGWLGYGKDMLLVTESVAIASMIHGVTKFATRRPRPYAFDERLPLDERRQADSMLSFFSGHAAHGFAAATSYSYLFTLRHPNSPMVVPVWLTMLTLATTESVLRPFTGEHYWTDVLVGIAVGTTVGLLVPWLHRSGEPLNSGSATVEPTVTVAPIALPQGAGLSLSILRW